MTQRPLRVLIVSGVGAHQKAIQTLCASAPQIKVIDTAFSSLQAFSMARDNLPDLLILGANLTKNRVCETLSQIRTLPNPPYCIVLTVSEFGACFDQQVEADRVIPTASFAYRLPEILKQVSLR